MRSTEASATLTYMPNGFVLPPRAGAVVCSGCRSWKATEYEFCRNCNEARTILGHALPVLPVSLYAKPSRLRDLLAYYKQGREVHHPEYLAELRIGAQRFLNAWGSALDAAYGPFNCVCPVPSTNQGDDLVADLFEVPAAVIAPLARLLAPSGQRPTHGSLAFDHFRMIEGAGKPGWRILLVDDVFTTGARIQSAAATLRLSGFVVPVGLVLGRRINPKFSPQAGAVWRRQVAVPYDLSQPPYWGAA